MKENLRLRKELEEEKRKSLSKKSGVILCKGNRLEAYRFLEQYHNFLAYVGCLGGYIFIQMPTTTAVNTGKQIISPQN